MSTLEKLFEDYEATAKTAAINIEEMPAATRGGWGSRVREAQDHLKEVRAEYKKTLLKNAVAIFLEGDAAKIEAAVALARDNGGVVIDANALYERLAKPAEATLSEARQWGVAATHRLHLGIQEVMYETGLNEVTMPASELPYVATYQDVVAHVKHLIRNAVGDQLNRFYVEESLARAAIEIRYTGVTVPVLVVNAEPSEQATIAASFLKGNTSMKIEATDEVDKDFLSKLLREAGKKVRSPKK